MVILVGIILLALGISLCVAWSGAVLLVLKGVVPLTLLFFGALFLLVGYSERKGAREFEKMVNSSTNETSEDG